MIPEKWYTTQVEAALKNIFLPAREIVLVAINKLGQEKDAQCHRDIVAKQVFAADPLAENVLELGQGDEIEIDNGIGDLKKIVHDE